MERTPLYEKRDHAHYLAVRELAPVYVIQVLGVIWSFHAIAFLSADPQIRSLFGALLIITIIAGCYLAMLSSGYRGEHIRFYHEWFDIDFENTSYEDIDVVALFSTYTHTGSMRVRTPTWSKAIWCIGLLIAPVFPALIIYLLSETPTIRRMLARLYNRIHFGSHPTGDALVLSWPSRSTPFVLQRDTLVIPLHIAQQDKLFLDFIWNKVLDRFETIPEYESEPPANWFVNLPTVRPPKSTFFFHGDSSLPPRRQ